MASSTGKKNKRPQSSPCKLRYKALNIRAKNKLRKKKKEEKRQLRLAKLKLRRLEKNHETK